MRSLFAGAAQSRYAARLMTGALIAQRLREVRFAKRNERLGRAAGAVEHGAGHYPAFFVLHPAWLAGMLWESRHQTRTVRWPWLMAAAAAQPARYATMAALGEQWTTRILITPGVPAVTRGPYRWLRHPAYLAVTIELLAAALAVRARATAIISTLANAVLLGVFRIPAENAAERTR